MKRGGNVTTDKLIRRRRSSLINDGIILPHNKVKSLVHELLDNEELPNDENVKRLLNKKNGGLVDRRKSILIGGKRKGKKSIKKKRTVRRTKK